MVAIVHIIDESLSYLQQSNHVHGIRFTTAAPSFVPSARASFVVHNQIDKPCSVFWVTSEDQFHTLMGIGEQSAVPDSYYVVSERVTRVPDYPTFVSRVQDVHGCVSVVGESVDHLAQVLAMVASTSQRKRIPARDDMHINTKLVDTILNMHDTPHLRENAVQMLGTHCTIRGIATSKPEQLQGPFAGDVNDFLGRIVH